MKNTFVHITQLKSLYSNKANMITRELGYVSMVLQEVQWISIRYLYTARIITLFTLYRKQNDHAILGGNMLTLDIVNVDGNLYTAERFGIMVKGILAI